MSLGSGAGCQCQHCDPMPPCQWHATRNACMVHARRGHAPSRFRTCCSGLAMVALVTTNTGCARYSRSHSRRSRRSTSAAWHPNTPLLGAVLTPLNTSQASKRLRWLCARSRQLAHVQAYREQGVQRVLGICACVHMMLCGKLDTGKRPRSRLEASRINLKSLSLWR